MHHDEIAVAEMVAVGMGDQADFDLCQIQPMLQEMHVSIGPEIQEKVIIDQGLSPGADLPAAVFPRVFTDGAMAENAGDSLRR